MSQVRDEIGGEEVIRTLPHAPASLPNAVGDVLARATGAFARVIRSIACRMFVFKRAIRCACLGPVLKLPMTKVTLVEDLGMAAMLVLLTVNF